MTEGAQYVYVRLFFYSILTGGIGMNFPEDLKYAKNDEWVRVEGNIAIIGISDYAQDQLSDIVYL